MTTAEKQVRGERCHSARLNETAVREIRFLSKKLGRSYSKIAKQFGVDKKTVERVVRGISWRHVS